MTKVERSFFPLQMGRLFSNRKRFALLFLPNSRNFFFVVVRYRFRESVHQFKLRIFNFVLQLRLNLLGWVGYRKGWFLVGTPSAIVCAMLSHLLLLVLND